MSTVELAMHPAEFGKLAARYNLVEMAEACLGEADVGTMDNRSRPKPVNGYRERVSKFNLRQDKRLAVKTGNQTTNRFFLFLQRLFGSVFDANFGLGKEELCNKNIYCHIH